VKRNRKVANCSKYDEVPAFQTNITITFRGRLPVYLNEADSTVLRTRPIENVSSLETFADKKLRFQSKVIRKKGLTF